MTERLAAQQAALLAALGGTQAAPAGFDPARLRAAAAALADKRRRAVERTWPAAVAQLGSDFAARFADYAHAVALPQQGGPLADGRAFVRWLARTHLLSDALRLHALAVDVSYARTTHGLMPRRWPGVRCVWLPQAGRLVVAVRWANGSTHRVVLRVRRPG